MFCRFHVPSLLWLHCLAVFLMALSFSPSSAFVLPDTGITTCYDANGNEIGCPVPGEAYYGQDAHFGPGDMSFTVNGDGTLTDENTALVWELKTNADGQVDAASFGDADNLYSWSAAQALVAQMNAATYLGHSDWRLPKSAELGYLVDLSVAEPGPTITSAYFPQTRAGHYWTADQDSVDTANAWAIDFSTADDTLLAKTTACHVRVVRGGVQ